MNSPAPERPDPDELLTALRKEEEVSKAKLKIFFGMCAGVGKTYEMLKAAHEVAAKRVDVVIGFVETHKRPETEALVEGLTIVPRKRVEYKGTVLEEMDLDAILSRKPSLVLVDELAHTNAPGSRHKKRYQDVQELLDNGIDVYTTVNVQHLESRADTVAQISGAIVRETVPDSVFEHADEVEIIDIPPDELLKRLSEGKVYTPERSQRAIENFFTKGNLTALREMSLRLTAERVDHQLRDYMRMQRIAGPWKSGQRLLVGITASPQSVSLIRWARRMSYTMNASWVAVYVETSTPLPDASKSQLAENLKLAAELGAEIITTADEDIAPALVRVAHQQNATQILIGKSDRRFSFRKNVLQRVIEQSGGLDVYVVGGEEGNREADRKIRIPEFHAGWLQYVIAAAIILLVASVSYPLRPFLGYQTVSLILLLVVALLPLRLSAGPVLVAAAVSALVWDYFFIPPEFTFSITHPQDALMFVSYFAIASVTGTLSARIRAREKAVRQREERATALYTLTRDLSSARSQDEVANATVANIRKHFDAQVAVLLSDPDGDIFTNAHPASTFAVDAKEFSVAAWVYWNEKKAGKFTDTLPFARATYYPMTGPRYPLGVVGVELNQHEQLSLDQETLLRNFISQIAATLEREQLNEMTKKSIAFVESERLYKTLFNSISHELRTPIAAIVSASEGLMIEQPDGRRSIRQDLTEEIHTAAERLNRLVEHLLDMTRLESGRITPRRDWCDLHDLIGGAVRKLGKELSGRTVVIDIVPEMPLVKIDYGLIEQAATNLLHNASLYTPEGSTIEIRAFTENQDLVLIVADNGPGFPNEALPHVFEKFYRVPGTKAGGTGLGLSIVRGFIDVHNGSIDVRNMPTGGVQFTIRIPTEFRLQEPQAGEDHE